MRVAPKLGGAPTKEPNRPTHVVSAGSPGHDGFLVSYHPSVDLEVSNITISADLHVESATVEIEGLAKGIVFTTTLTGKRNVITLPGKFTLEAGSSVVARLVKFTVKEGGQKKENQDVLSNFSLEFSSKELE